MNWMKRIMVGLSIIGMLCAAVSFAQQPEQQPGRSPSVPPSRPGAPDAVAPKAATPEAPPVPKASTFLGSPVVNPQGDNLGKIEDLVLDPATGRVTYAALSHGTILGFGGKLFAVSWEALKLQSDGKTFVLNVSKESLEDAPGFDKSNWPKQPDPMLRVSAPGTGTGSMPLTEAASRTDVSATVQEVDAQKQTVTLRIEPGENVELQAPAAVLADLQIGDAVEVKMVGLRASEIRKKE